MTKEHSSALFGEYCRSFKHFYISVRSHNKCTQRVVEWHFFYVNFVLKPYVGIQNSTVSTNKISRPWPPIRCPTQLNIVIYCINIAPSNAIGPYGCGWCVGSGRINQRWPYFKRLSGDSHHLPRRGMIVGMCYDGGNRLGGPFHRWKSFSTLYMMGLRRRMTWIFALIAIDTTNAANLYHMFSCQNTAFLSTGSTNGKWAQSMKIARFYNIIHVCDGIMQ